MRRHHRARTVAVLFVGFALIVGCGSSAPPESAVATEAPRVASLPDALVSTQWLSEHLDDPDLVVLDCSVKITQGDSGLVVESGRADYESGHIPSAGFADLTGDLSDPDSELLYGVPTPERFAAAMGALGVGDDTLVVLYDSSISAWAARVWWMLRWAGFDRAAILDGGLAAWTAEKRPLSTEPVDEPVRTLTAAPRPELIADRDEVFAAIDDDAVRLIDVLPAAHYRGDIAMYARPGHIPTAGNVPVTELLDETGHYRPDAELATLFDGNHDARTITYCGGGIAASAAAFAMTRLGYSDVAVYAGSLQEWTADPANPMVVGTGED